MCGGWPARVHVPSQFVCVMTTYIMHIYMVDLINSTISYNIVQGTIYMLYIYTCCTLSYMHVNKSVYFYTVTVN